MREAKVPIGLAAALKERGISLSALEQAAGLWSGELERSNVRLPIPRYFVLWRAIREISGDASIGLELAQAVKFDLTEPLFLAIVSAPTFLEALEVLSTYKRILSPEALELARTRSELRLTYEWPEDPPDVLIDVEIAFVVELARRATAQPSLAPVRVSLRRPRVTGAHATFFRAPIVTNAAANTVAFDAALASTPLWTRNEELAEALSLYLVKHSGAPSAIARVRAAIARGLNGRRPTVASVSRELAMSTRSLQRILKEERTSFRALLDDVRNERALAYLRGSSLTDAEVAFLLGFEDRNSFYRAFRAWNGRSPGEFRERVQT